MTCMLVKASDRVDMMLMLTRPAANGTSNVTRDLVGVSQSESNSSSLQLSVPQNSRQTVLELA